MGSIGPPGIIEVGVEIKGFLRRAKKNIWMGPQIFREGCGPAFGGAYDEKVRDGRSRFCWMVCGGVLYHLDLPSSDVMRDDR